MPWWHPIYGLLLLISTATLSALAFSALRQGTLLARLFAIWAGGSLLFTLSSLLALFTDSPESLRALALFRIIVGAPMSVFSLVLVAVYIGWPFWLRPATLVLLSIVPALTIGIILTGHGDWVIGTFEPGRYPKETAFVAGSWLPVHLFYSFAIFSIALAMLFMQIFRTFSIYRLRAVIVFVGALISFLFGLLFFFPAIPPLNWSAVGLSITALIWYGGLFRFQLLATPLARDVIMEKMEDAVWIVADDRLIDLNPAAERLLGIPRSLAIASPLNALGSRVQLPAAVTSSDQPVRTDLTLEWPRGEVHHFDVHVSPVQTEGDETIARLVVLRDVSERVRLVEDLDAYAGAVAHDLKNPLDAIVGSLQLLDESRGMTLDGELYELVRSGSDSAKRMCGIIDALLLLATIRRQREVPQHTIDMGPLVEVVLRTRLGPMIAERQADVRLPDHWPAAKGYGPWVEEVWANYLSNAVKYGGDPPHITIGGEPADGMVRFWVRDDGRGLSEHERGRLFEEFTRLAPTRAAGHGLGLSITRRIVERLGGQVGVESAPGSGSTFWFILPEG